MASLVLGIISSTIGIAVSTATASYTIAKNNDCCCHCPGDKDIGYDPPFKLRPFTCVMKKQLYNSGYKDRKTVLKMGFKELCFHWDTAKKLGFF